jgi:RNA polymerase sigma-70 factor (ECF subfamily)
MNNNVSNKNDSELILLVKNSDTKAFKVLFEKYFLSLCNFSFFYVKSVDLSEEVVSDVFLNIWLTRNRIEIKSNLKAYLFTAVRNRSINCLVKEKRNWENIEICDQEGLISNDSPYDTLSYNELESVIESVIKKIPPKRQLVFRLNRIDGLSYKEIAEVLSVSVNTVQNHMVKAVEFITNQYPKIKSLFTLLIFSILL